MTTQQQAIDDYNTFRSGVLKVSCHRKSKPNKTIKSSTIIRRIKKKYNIDIDTTKYSKIIRLIHNLLADEFIKYGKYTLPHKLGSFELNKCHGRISMENGKIVRTMTVNWDKTLQYWFENEKGKEKKVLVWNNPGPIYKVKWSLKNTNVKNIVYYSYKTSRSLKNKIKDKINNGGIPAYEQRVYYNT